MNSENTFRELINLQNFNNFLWLFSDWAHAAVSSYRGLFWGRVSNPAVNIWHHVIGLKEASLKCAESQNNMHFIWYIKTPQFQPHWHEVSNKNILSYSSNIYKQFIESQNNISKLSTLHFHDMIIGPFNNFAISSNLWLCNT